MGSPSPLTHPLASHVLLLSQLYHSASLRWEAMQLSLCLFLSFALTSCPIHTQTHARTQTNNLNFYCFVKVAVNLVCACTCMCFACALTACGCMHVRACACAALHINAFLFLRLRSRDRLHVIIFAFEDKAIEILPLLQTMTDFHFSSLEKLGTYISICLRPV